MNKEITLNYFTGLFVAKGINSNSLLPVEPAVLMNNKNRNIMTTAVSVFQTSFMWFMYIKAVMFIYCTNNPAVAKIIGLQMSQCTVINYFRYNFMNRHDIEKSFK